MTGQVLSDADVEAFIGDGFVKIEGAFSSALAAEAREILWRDLGCSEDAPEGWTRPVIRLGQYGQAPFRQAANRPCLHAAFDRLTGPGAWLPLNTLGTFPVRFPVPGDPGDTGWHADASFGTEDPDFLSWRINIRSRGRALLMLFLFSDVGTHDAPTRIRAGSHRDIARVLAPAGEAGLPLRALARNGFSETAHRPEVLATGEAGTVYLCHPFLVHAAQTHRGHVPRFLAQPPLLPARSSGIPAEDGPLYPVQRAIREALSEDD